MRAFLLLITLFLAGCQTRNAPPTAVSSPAPAELDVLVSCLSRHYSTSSNTPLVIRDTFSIADLQSGDDSHEKLTRSLLSHASADVPADLIRDFCSKNAQPQKVWTELRERLPVTFLSQAYLETLFSNGRHEKPDGWDKFYAKYPGSPGIITLSRVGFNRRGDLAMLYLGSQSHWLAGGGHIRILRKQGNTWVELPASIGPMWVS